MVGALFLVSVPIGNLQDITLRALDLLRTTDLVVCEELKVGRKLMAFYKIKNELANLNEHNSKDASKEIISLLKSGKNIALISDAGTPVFSDPGYDLVQLCFKHKIKVSSAPGPSSLMPALILSGFSLKEFHYLGWLPRKTEERIKKIKTLRNCRHTTIIMETPYRLNSLINLLYEQLDKNQMIALCMDLTKDEEEIIRGTLVNVWNKIKTIKMKREFVLILNGNKH